MAKKVLIVEDEPKNMKLFCDLLQQFGYETIEANDGEEGVMLTRATKPDIILMDIMMPKLDGLEATRIIKADKAICHIPIIALTSLAMNGDKERTLEAGCDGYLTKPVDIHELLNMVMQFLGAPTKTIKCN